MNFLTEPVPHDEAVELIRHKPAVARDIYDGLPQEMRGRAFTITGIEDFDTLQAVRDEIAKLPAGADWKKVKKEIAAKISPWLDEDEAERRAKLLLNHHGRAAYAATNARITHAQREVFPFLMYRSSRLSKEPRASHRALDGLILPSDHPFWDTHTPPWEFGCRCLDPIPLTAEDADEERALDRGRGEETRRVASPEQLAALENGTLVRGPGAVLDVQTPRQKSGGGYEWSWRDSTLPFEEIRKRWDEDVARGFEEWADGIPMEGGTSLLAHLTGLAPGGGRQRTVVRAATFAQALAESGLAEKALWERKDIANLRAAMRVENPLRAEDKLAGIVGARSQGEITGREIKRAVQDTLDMLPRGIAETLAPLEIHLVKTLPENRKGQYSPIKGGARLSVSLEALKGLRGEARRQELRRILRHEQMHWIHMSATHPRAAAYRETIRSHYAVKTTSDLKMPDGKGNFFREDQWWDLRAGKEYKEENGAANGLEVPAVYFELWETPETMRMFSDLEKPGGAAFRETFALVHTIFDSEP